MNSDRHKKAMEIFDRALELDASQWASFLQRACGEDTELLREVQSLLDHDANPLTFVEKAADNGMATIAGAAGFGGYHPARIGRYRVLRKIGDGGMGVVFLAEQENPKRTVALKVIKPGLDGAGLRARFQFEGQILGSLQHPGIAQIFEAGTAESELGPQPFFALEYIEGVPITEYADSHRLGTRQRLQLIAEVCDAVNHAHQKGVIHRDIKPSNILVDKSGKSKILDFGVARATDGDVQLTTIRTDVGQLIGTVRYMSPEQVKGNSREIDTRSDVYALGVVTFELLTGRLPNDLSVKSVPEAIRIISEEEPTRLSSLDKTLRGDVDTIVSKALEKEKSRRYGSASEFADDIRRFLNDRPIAARPASTFYQLTKFARRNRALVTGIVGVIVALLIGTVVSAWQAGVARREAKRVSQINMYFMELLASPDPQRMGREVSMAEVLNVAAGRVDKSFPDDPETRALLYATLGQTYSKLGMLDEAERMVLSALKLRGSVLGSEHQKTVTTLNDLGMIRNMQGRPDEALEIFEESLAGHRKAWGPQHRFTLHCQENIAVSRLELGQLERAEATFKEVLALRMAGGTSTEAEIIKTRSNLAGTLGRRGKYAEAVPIQREILRSRRALYGDDHPDTIMTISALASHLGSLNEFEEAEKFHLEAVEGMRRVFGDDHYDTLLSINNLASFYQTQNRHEEAKPLCKELTERAQRVLGDRHANTLLFRNNYSALLLHEQEFDQAEAEIRDVIRIARASLPENHFYHAAFEFRLGDCLYRSKRFDEAVKVLQSAVERMLPTLGSAHPNTRKAIGLLADALSSSGRETEAAEWRAKLHGGKE